MIAQGRIDTDEAAFANFNTARYNDMRCQETMILDNRMMTNMVAAPHRHIVTDFHKRLDGIVFKNKAIFANITFIQHGRIWTDIACNLIAQRFGARYLSLRVWFILA